VTWPPGVLTWQIGVTDIGAALQRCRSAGISFDLEDNNPAPEWTYPRLTHPHPERLPASTRRPNE
jgi:hypothetical protein